ncbi:MAG: hypothetical protein H6819_03910 [Phycisphaerales bacterium]|nr:hypothetical protein [Phycisphaerales bacterium]MCB9856344.1 hypothetical protein [Phycisphaerales bacterium]MCB9864016.1 hypothetical protein [Phycisphaerales bacterium]
MRCGHALLARLDLLPLGPGVAPRGASEGTDVSHYRLEIEILPQCDINGVCDAVLIQGTNTVDVGVTAGPTSDFALDLIDTLSVTGVSGDVAGWSHINDQVEITLDRTYSANESFQVVVAYEGEPDPTGLGIFKWWIQNDELAIATVSEPFGASQWWPCRNTLNDKATMEMIVTVPDPLVVASNGVLESTTALGDGRTRYSWRSLNPLTSYLASLAIANFQRYDLVHESNAGGLPASMPIYCYIRTNSWDFNLDRPMSTAKLACDELIVMLTTFESMFGPYPFRNEKYGVAQTGSNVGPTQPNMENQTISSMNGLGNNRDIMAHELAHQWFGDYVTCATWHDIWLNEGIASYAEALYLESYPSGSTGQYWQHIKDHKPTLPDRVVYRPDISTTGAIFSTNDVYRKGEWVCHMLRYVMGDEAFFQAMTDYLADHARGYATTADFITSVSNSFGHDLTWFTDQWIMNPGAPDYDFSYETRTLNGRDYAYVRLRQEQDLEGFGLFTMPVEIMVWSLSGNSTHRVWNDDWTDYFVIPLDNPPLYLAMDAPNYQGTYSYILADSRHTFRGAFPRPPVVLSLNVTPYTVNTTETSVVIEFSEDIGAFDATDIDCSGSTGTDYAPANVSYDTTTQVATVTFTSLPSDEFTLRILADGVTSDGFSLDGEIDDSAWYDDILLPSGDGQPGGDAIFTFVIPAGDANCDAAVDLDDIAAFTAVLLGNDTTPCHVLRSDVNNDGNADGLDVAGFVDAVLGQ